MQLIYHLLQHWGLVRLLVHVSGAILVAATAPLIFELFVLTLASCLPPRDVGSKSEGHRLRLTCIIPAHNEEALIARCVHSLTQAKPESCDVLVIAHRCTDRTVARAREAGAQVSTLEGVAGQGKGDALQFGFREALARGAEAVVVVDADSVASPGFLDVMQSALSNGTDAVQCRYTMHTNCNVASRTRLAALGFQAFNVVRPRGRERLGLSSGIFGNGFGITASLLRRVPYQAMSLVEDLEYHLALISAGVRVRFLDSTSVWSELPTNGPGSKSQRVRWEGGRVRMMRSHAPKLSGGVLRGKVELLEPLLDLLSLPLANAAAILALLFCFPGSCFKSYALCACAVLAVHLVISAREGDGVLAVLSALHAVPRYILWKIWLLPQTYRSSKASAAWVRTSRTDALSVPQTPENSSNQPEPGFAN